MPSNSSNNAVKLLALIFSLLKVWNFRKILLLLHHRYFTLQEVETDVFFIIYAIKLT